MVLQIFFLGKKKSRKVEITSNKNCSFVRPAEGKCLQCFNFHFMKTVSSFSNQLLQKDLPLVREEASHLVRVLPPDKEKDVSEALNADNGLSAGKAAPGGGCGERGRVS